MRKGWKKCKIKDIADIVMGQSPPSSTYNEEGKGLPFYQGVVDFGHRFVTPRVFCTEPKKIIDENYVLLSVRAPVGEVNLTSEKCSIGRGNAGLKAKNGQKLFLYYLLKYNMNNLKNSSEGTVFASINKSTIENLEIEIPESLEEQKAIAAVLSSLDDKIDLLHRQNKTLESMAETLFRKWFIEDANENWEKYKIGDKLEVLLGGTPSTKKPEYWNGKIPWINSGEINKFRILEPTKYITQAGLDNSSTKLFPKGTTVLAITGATLGQVSRLEIDACANQSVIGIIGNEEFSNEYIYLWIKHYIKDIISNQTGGAQQHINRNDVKNAIILKPDKVVYEKVMNLVKPIFDKISKNSFQIRTLEQLRDTLLPKLMSGQVRVRI